MSRRLNENLEDSCRIIANYISKEKQPEVRELMLKDFLAKKRGLMMTNSGKEPIADLKSLVSVLGNCFPADVKRLIAMLPETTTTSEIQETEGTVVRAVKAMPTTEMIPKEKIDVAIVTVIPSELKAAGLAFDIKTGVNDADKNVAGLRFYKGTLRRPGKKGTLSQFSIMLTMVGEPTNIPCAIACERMFHLYDPEICILIGIAAGLKGKVKILDVVAAKLVIDYEHQRLEPGIRKKRPAPFPIDEDIKRDIQDFNPHPTNWGKLFKNCCKKLEKNQIPDSINTDKFPSFKTGVILAGEKLLADGSVPKLKKEFHDQTLAVEMEGSGFCKACRDWKIPWLVFRGISDYGDPKKRKKLQAAAAASAATAARHFLQTAYRTKAERKF